MTGFIKWLAKGHAREELSLSSYRVKDALDPGRPFEDMNPVFTVENGLFTGVRILRTPLASPKQAEHDTG